MAGSATGSRDLNFVSVESGVGWIPFALDALDWQWKNCGVALEHPEYDLLPTEYFKRQIYGCFWFEVEPARFAIERLGDDNILYETDFPHPTSMSPGPASAAAAPERVPRGQFLGPARHHPRQDPARQRGPALPPGLKRYRTIGAVNDGSIPARSGRYGAKRHRHTMHSSIWAPILPL